jgi:yecA family protein
MTTGKRQRTREARKSVKTMADYAMSFERLGLRMSERARSATLRHPQATSLSMLDGSVKAVVAGPVSMNAEEWVCPLLGVEPDAFNHDTEEFSAIAATLMRHNAISNTLSTAPESFEPLFLRNADGDADARPWCMGFYAVMKLRLMAWSRLLTPRTIEHGLLLPILFHCVDDTGHPVLGPRLRGPDMPFFAREAWRDIPAVVEAMRQFWMPTRFTNGAS